MSTNSAHFIFKGESKLTDWVTSDIHFFHENIIEFCPETRPGHSKEEMNNALIDEWNSKVDVNDKVYFGGDFSFGKYQQTEEIINQLNGEIIFIMGNHDLKLEHLYRKYFYVTDYLTFKRNKRRIVLFHYPIASWHSMEHGAIHLHGHTHGSYNGYGKCYDVGYDSLGRIVTLDEAIEIAKSKGENQNGRPY